MYVLVGLRESFQKTVEYYREVINSPVRDSSVHNAISGWRHPQHCLQNVKPVCEDWHTLIII